MTPALDTFSLNKVFLHFPVGSLYLLFQPPVNPLLLCLLGLDREGDKEVIHFGFSLVIIVFSFMFFFPVRPVAVPVVTVRLSGHVATRLP